MRSGTARTAAPVTATVAAIIFSLSGVSAIADSAGTTPGGPVIDHVVSSLTGEQVNLADFRGKALLIVNTASKCGFTSQYAELQTLHETYAERGLVVIGFPSNDFGGQEPGTAEQIGSFCKLNYGVTFPMMAKVHAKGPEKAPIYATLTEQTPEGIAGEVRWNFTKFLVDGEGKVVERFESSVKPTSAEITTAIEKLLG